MPAGRCQDDGHARPPTDARADDGMARLRLQRRHMQAVEHILGDLVEIPARTARLLALMTCIRIMGCWRVYEITGGN